MRILIFSDPHFEDEHFVGYCRDLCEGLSAAGHVVKILSGGAFFFLRSVVSGRRADVILTPNFPGTFRAALALAGFFKKKVFVKIVSDYAWETSVKKGKTFLMVSDFQRSERTGEAAHLHRMQVRLCKVARSVIVPSGFMADMVEGWGIEKEKIQIISDGMGFKVPEITKEAARKKVGIPGNLIVSAGQLVSWGGFRMLVKIMPQLLHINQFFRLIIIGDGPDRPVLQSMIKNSALEKKIYLVDPKNKEESACFLAAAEMFILNSSHEPFPSWAIGAMFAGVPVITTPVGANQELIRQGENGFMVKYNDEFNLLEAIKTIWYTAELREKFIEEGKKTAQGFSLENMVKDTSKILSS